MQYVSHIFKSLKTFMLHKRKLYKNIQTLKPKMKYVFNI